MISCPICKTVHVDNTLFCSECGAYLLDDLSRDTEVMGADIKWLGDTADKARIRSALADDEPVIIRLTIGHSKREVELEVGRKAILIGRLDPTANILPEVDLSSEAHEKGISRRHARIFKHEGNLVIEDLGSANGSYINGKRLVPYLFEHLSDGDLLQLGTLLIRIKIRT
jgi:pSer/pThr/pTyr-binding forkhead associated (FHA) protein